MNIVPALVDGQLSELDKKLMIRNYGILLPSAMYITTCGELHTKSSPRRGPVCVPTEEDPSDFTRLKSHELQLGTVHVESLKTGAPILATGGFYSEYSNNPKDLEWNKNVIFTIHVADMESCEDHVCLKKAEDTFINTAMCALEYGVKAVLISYEQPKWSHENPAFSSFNFAVALKKLVEKNFKMQFRDLDSRKEQTKKKLRDIEGGQPFYISEEIDDTIVPVEPFDNPYTSTTSRQIWVKIDLNEKENEELLSEDDLHDQAWNWWSVIQVYVGYNPKLGLCLELGSSAPRNSKRLERWFAERLRAFIFPIDIFKYNRHGFPILSSQLKSFVMNSHHIPSITYLMCGTEDSIKEIELHKNQFLYMLHLYKEYYKTVTDPDRRKMMRHMADQPIRPLQPLRDHLSGEIYAVFEADPIKYRLYFDATLEALKDLKRLGEVGTKENPVVIMVVGAGRGPLVTEAANAASQLQMDFKIYAVDKNPVAVCAMLTKMTSDWKSYASSIQIVQSDMREFNPEDRADIMISELLGSFACNELSPECLDGAQRLLKANGISIPCSYSNFLQPVMAVHLYEDIHTFAPKYKRITNELVLVEMRSFAPIDDYKNVFTFTHPNFEKHSNERKIILQFKADLDYRLHGFAGYFELHLYKGISMNILPDRQTIGLGSWYPAFFPLHHPVDVKQGDDIVFRITRQVDFQLKRVWYSWALMKPQVLPIQNAHPDHWFSM